MEITGFGTLRKSIFYAAGGGFRGHGILTPHYAKTAFRRICSRSAGKYAFINISINIFTEIN
jgi:hypothetical protein